MSAMAALNPGEGMTPELLRKRWMGEQSGNVVEFYGHSSGKFRCFSNFFAHKEPFLFEVPASFREGLDVSPKVPCEFSEKAIMLCKAAVMGDPKTYAEIAAAAHPSKAKALGRKVRNFDARKWDRAVCSVAFEVVHQKFRQTPSIQEILLSTGDRVIAEATVNDANWGIGINIGDPRAQEPASWKGTNILGWALMEARTALRRPVPSSAGEAKRVVIDLDDDAPPSKKAASSGCEDIRAPGPGEGVTPDDLRRRWSSFTTAEEAGEIVGFYGHSRGKYACFSNFYKHEPFDFEVPAALLAKLPEGHRCPSAVPCAFSEKAIMLCKAAVMGDAETYQAVCKVPEPGEAKKLGRLVRNFDNDTWNSVVCSVAFQVVHQKFSKTNSLREVLMKTGDHIIAEASPDDANWGIGMGSDDPRLAVPSRWPGTNVLGWALMEARQALKMETTQQAEESQQGTKRRWGKKGA